MIFIQSINEIQAKVNSLDNDLAVLLLVIQGLGRVQAPWIDHRGRHKHNLSSQQELIS